MVLLERIELSASPLPRECSTTELQQRDHRKRPRGQAGRGSGRALPCRIPLSIISAVGKPAAMADTKQTREERLAARLRENLRLRRAQARALKSGEEGATNPALSNDKGER